MFNPNPEIRVTGVIFRRVEDIFRSDFSRTICPEQRAAFCAMSLNGVPICLSLPHIGDILYDKGAT